MKLFKANLTHKMLTLTLSSILMAFAFMGCEKDVYNPNGKIDGETPNPFQFATTSSIQLNVKYEVPTGYKVLFEVYLENPLTEDKDGQTVKRTDLKPVIRRMTDENGRYSSKETITADFSSEAYIYTSNIGVPGLFKTKIEGNAINAGIKFEITEAPQTRVVTSVPKGYFTLGTWAANGRPNNLDSEGTLELSASILKTIDKTLAEGNNCPKELRQSVDFLVSDPKQRKVEISVRFIGGNSSAASMFGYYCYKEGANKAQIQKAKKYVAFPNTNMLGGKPVALKGGECVKLHYIDENGVDNGTVFPNGIRVGWFLLNDAFYNPRSGEGYGAFYSTTALNSDGRTHTAAFRINDFVVLSFEDWTDQDYNDVMFNVWSNPIEAIVPPELPNIPEEKPDEGDKSVAYRMTYKGIVAFEDNWPAKGDYDLNDVIVKYNSVLSFNTKNEVLSTEDEFTALWSGASYKNGFGYELNTDRSNVTTVFTENPTTFPTQGLDADLSNATVNVFVDAINVTGGNTKTATYRLKNTFTVPVDHDIFGVAPYNPFITVHSQQGNSRGEVHLINHKPTTKADMSKFHTGLDLSDIEKGIFYIAAENYPFAIHLIDAENFSTTEKESIDKSYPAFANWAKSNGTEDKDWYK